jgi:hypothetical protein
MKGKNSKSIDPLYAQRLFYLIHGVLYTIGWTIAFYFMVFSQSRLDQVWIAIIAMIMWTPLLLLHTASHFRSIGRAQAASNEREVYREGFRDGARYSADDVYDARPRRHLELDEDGELVEWETKQKRG